jgi:hypothetical protein
MGEARQLGGEVESSWNGERVLRGLARLDRVSALLFACIYRSFSDLSDFEAELERLKAEPVPGEDQLAITVPSEPGASIDRPPTGSPRGPEGELKSVRRGHAGHP